MKTTKENAASPCQGEAAQQTKLGFDHTALGKQRATLIHSHELQLKVRQHQPRRPILGKYRSGGRFQP